MKPRNIDHAVRQAFTNATPNVLDSVLSDCGQQKGTVIVMTERKKISWGKKLAAIAAALALILGIGIGAGIYYTNNTVVSTISLDVNPSIELRVNRNERVLEANARNMDAQVVLGQMELEGSDLDVAVNAIIGSMLRNGYITELANSVLISVDSKDAAAAVALQEKLTAEVNTLLNTQTFTGAVISQTVTQETELEKLAQQFNITVGKAQLIRKIMAQDSRHTFEELANLSINELNLLSQSAQTPVEDVAVIGKPSDKEYIGADAAKHAALMHAGDEVAERATQVKVELDCEDSIMIYEVEFTVDGYEYDYEIDAKTGAVRKAEKELDDDSVSTDSKVPPDGKIGEENAVETALNHAGFSMEQITGLEVEFDGDETPHYDVSFHAQGYEYDYEIGAYDSSVLKSEKEPDDDRKESVDAPVNGGETDQIGEQEALSAALKHAGLTKEQVKELEVEKDVENGKPVFEISFKSGGYEYDYEIDGMTGGILKSEKERDD